MTGLSAEEEVRVARCARLGRLYSPLDSSCHLPLSPGPCEEGERLVLDPETLLADCQARRCEEADMVLHQAEGRCVDIFQTEVGLHTASAGV